MRCGVIIMYKKLLELDGSEANWMRKLSDNSVFPKVEGNRHYREYLEWLAEGNTPEEAE